MGTQSIQGLTMPDGVPAAPPGAPVLEMRGVVKLFDSFRALDRADLAVQAGEVHALLGENGAGKSSLMNVAIGLYRPDEGEMRLHGAPCRLSGPSEAARRGIGMVHQHYKLVPTISVAENMMLSLRGLGYRRAKARVLADIAQMRERLGITLDPDAIIGALSVAERQRVEIVKALATNPDILILDEPTAVLTDGEAETLLLTMRRLAASGTAVVLVTHKLADVRTHADQVTVMRAGRTIATCDPRETTAEELTTLVIGARAAPPPRAARAPGEARLRVSGLRCARADGLVTVPGADLIVRAGEIYGLAGVGGNGQTELVEALAGIRPALGGSVELEGAGDVAALTPAERSALGIAVITADRAKYGLAASLPIAENYAIKQVGRGVFGGPLRVDRAAMMRATLQAVAEFEILGVRSPTQTAGLLSGGNAQKLVIARELATPPRVVIAHSPSRGLDARASTDIHRRLAAARDAGAAVFLVSEDLDEVLALADRVAVMTAGRIVLELTPPFSRQAIGAAMVGHA